MDALKKNAAAPRKRSGSPNISDASGTDTSRKKAKSKHPSSQPTPQPGSRAMSPAPSSKQVSPLAVSTRPIRLLNAAQPGKKRVRGVRPGGGPGSDIDTGAGSAADMSESGKPKKLKLNPPGVSSPSGTPQGSRAGSPTPFSATGPSVSRASSPEQGLSTGGTTPIYITENWTQQRLTVFCYRASPDQPGNPRLPELPYPGRDPRLYPSNWHSEQRFAQEIPPPYWRFPGEPSPVHCDCQGCWCLREGGSAAAPRDAQGELNVGAGSMTCTASNGRGVRMEYYVSILLLLSRQPCRI